MDRSFPVQRLLRDDELDFVSGLGARDGGGEAGLDTDEARLVAPLVRANRALRRARVTRQAGVLDLRRVQREGDIDLRGRNLSDADALLIVATLQQRPNEARRWLGSGLASGFGLGCPNPNPNPNPNLA